VQVDAVDLKNEFTQWFQESTDTRKNWMENFEKLTPNSGSKPKIKKKIWPTALFANPANEHETNSRMINFTVRLYDSDGYHDGCESMIHHDKYLGFC